VDLREGPTKEKAMIRINKARKKLDRVEDQLQGFELYKA
jgi:hypothetical protein